MRRRIFTERLPETVRPKARRTAQLGESQLAIGFAVGGEPGSRLARKLAMPVNGGTLLRMIRGASETVRDTTSIHMWLRIHRGQHRSPSRLDV